MELWSGPQFPTSKTSLRVMVNSIPQQIPTDNWATTSLVGDREQAIFGGDVQHIIRYDRGAVYAGTHIDFGNGFSRIVPVFENGNIAIFVTHVNFTVGNEGAPQDWASMS